MSGKVRVHELAKELGVTVKQLLLWISEQGEFVKSGSSRLPAPVADRLRETYGGTSGSRVVGAKTPQQDAVAKQDPRKLTGKPAQASVITQYCVGCKSRTSIKGFDVARGLCAACRSQADQSEAARSAVPRKPSADADGPKSWKCPNCLKRVDVGKSSALVEHQNARGRRCAGSGYQLPEKSVDALDYRVAGSFEGGRR